MNTEQNQNKCPTCNRLNISTDYLPTQQERKIIDFIMKFQLKNMRSPSYRDMAKHIGVKTTNSIHKYLYRLKENGFVDFTPAMKNSVRVIKHD